MPTLNNSKDGLALTALNYHQRKLEIKEIEKELASMRPVLEDGVDRLGNGTATGSRVAVIPYADKEIQLRKDLRLTAVLVPEAEDILRRHKLTECLETTTIIREDVIQRMYERGEISIDVMKELYVEKETRAFSVKVKKRFHEE